MCWVVFRANNDNGEFDLKAYGQRATKKRGSLDATATADLIIAECFRRKLGEARNWSRRRALEKLATSSLGFEWADDAEPQLDEDSAPPSARFNMNVDGVRVIN